MKTEWKDTSSYSHGQRGKVEPRSWGLSLPHITIGVHRHIDYPGDWLLSCYDVRIERRLLSFPEIELAQHEALEIVRKRLANMTADLA